jgi:hypothetical protein
MLLWWRNQIGEKMIDTDSLVEKIEQMLDEI